MDDVTDAYVADMYRTCDALITASIANDQDAAIDIVTNLTHLEARDVVIGLANTARGVIAALADNAAMDPADLWRTIAVQFAAEYEGLDS